MKKDPISEARQMVVGMTWLNVLLRQGSELIVHSMENRHYCTIGKDAVTDEHQSEFGLAAEMQEIHAIKFKDLECIKCDGNLNHYQFTWIRK